MGIQERKEREKQQRQEDILDAAEKVFFTKGFDNATMDLVAETAELSKGTLYLYFKTKDELYFGVARRGLSTLGNMFARILEAGGTGLDLVRGFGDAYISFYHDYPTYYAGLTYYGDAEVDWDDHSTPHARACHDEGTRVMGYLAQAIETGMTDGSLRQDLNPMMTGLWLWTQLTGILQFISTRKGDHIAREYDVSLEELVETSLRLAMRAISQ